MRYINPRLTLTLTLTLEANQQVRYQAKTILSRIDDSLYSPNLVLFGPCHSLNRSACIAHICAEIWWAGALWVRERLAVRSTSSGRAALIEIDI